MGTATKPTAKELTRHTWRGGPYAHHWSMSEDGQTKESLWFDTSQPVHPSKTWGERHQYFSVHPGTVKGGPHDRVTNATVAAINCEIGDFDAKDEVYPDEYAPFLPADFDTLKPVDQKRAIKDAQVEAMMLDLPKYKARAWVRVQSCPLAPTWTNDTGGGYQCYWFLRDTVKVDDTNREQLKALQAAWVEMIGADTGVKDLARVLRIPGSANVKKHFAPNYPIVTVLEYDPERLYSLAQFEQLTGIDDAWMAAQRAQQPERKPSPADSVIAQFNDAYRVGALLTKHGYQLGRTFGNIERYSRPGRDKGQTSVIVWTDTNRSYHHSSSDPLHCAEGHSWDAFDLYRLLEHGGDNKAAVVAAKKALGLWEDDPGGAQRMATNKVQQAQSAYTNGTHPQSNISLDYIGPAIWRNRDHDEPVTITGSLPPMNGIAWYSTAGSNAGLPGNELYLDDDTPEEAHPLDIRPRAGLTLGWVDEYADLMTLMTGSPREFNVLAGLAVAATAIQRRARLRMSFGDIYPNIYAAVIAPSSVYHKSSALAKPRALLQRAMLDNLLLSELFTSEGLLKQLQGQPAGLALRDEIGTLFASHNTKYLANLKPDLTALYDCYPYSRRLSNDEVKVQAPYLNILGATTPARFFEGVSYTDWQDGFLARWLFVMPEQEPNFDAMTGLYTMEHEERLARLALTLMNIDRQRETDFQLMNPAFQLWDAWQRKAAKDAYYYGDDVTAAIVTRYAAYALKFAMILAATNDSWEVITPATMQTAIDLADSFKATVYKLLSLKANYGVSGAKLQKIFKTLKRNESGEGLTQREIGRICSMKKAELTPCMEKLISIGAVTSETHGKLERYRAAIENLPAKAW